MNRASKRWQKSTGSATVQLRRSSATILGAESDLEKIATLAARWSLDPARVKWHLLRPATGIAGESAFE
jgi:hypothetical protein